MSFAIRNRSSGSLPSGPSEPGHARHAGGLHRLDRGDLVAHQADRLGPRADELEAALLDAFGEVGVLGQEAVTRVDRDGVGDLGRADDRRHVEVTVARGRRADADGFVGEQHVLQVAVGRGVHGDGLDAELAAGAQDAQRDLAAVGDDDLFEHRAASLLDDEQRLAELDRIAVLDQHRHDLAGLVGLDLVHHLHRLDDAEHVARP